MRPPLAILLALLCSHCAAPDPDASRAGALSNLLVADNFDLAQRSPELVAGKFRKMASGLYPFFRGTYPVFLHDQTVGRLAMATAFGSAESSRVQILGDPHPENIGCYRNQDGEIVVELNDFDAAGYGPFFHDVRRLALGFYALAVEAGLEDGAARNLAREVTAGYAVPFQDSDAEIARAMPTADSAGEIFVDLLDDAEEDGAAQNQLAKYTEVVDGQRHMTFLEAEIDDGGFIDTEVVPLHASETARVASLVGRYIDTVAVHRPAAHFAVKGASRRFGSGVSSYPLLRFYVLIEGDTREAADDVLLEIREVRDPPYYDSRRRLFPRRAFASNAERAVTLQRRAHATPTSDVYAGWAIEGAHAFKVRQRTGYQDGLEVARIVERLASGRFSAEDLTRAARYSGELLARSHARAPTADDAPGGRVIRSALKDNPIGLVDETDRFLSSYGPRLVDDYRLFRLALDKYGPLLGTRLK